MRTLALLLAFVLLPTVAFAAPFEGCLFVKARDGRYGFVWKPSGAHRKEAVLVLPTRYKGDVTREVKLFKTDETRIVTMTMKSNGICAPGGECLDRPTFYSRYTGRQLSNQFGSLFIRVKTKANNCYVYTIPDPAKRVD